MVNWFIDPSPSFYLLLLVIGLVLLAAWSRTRKKKFLVALAVVVAVAALFVILDWAFESDREQVVRKIHEAARSIEARNLDGFFRHVSNQFRYGTSDKAKFRAFLEHRNNQQLQSIRVWDIQIEKSPGQDGTPPNEMIVQFRLNVTGELGGGTQEGQFTCRSEFVRDPDKEWRLKTFQIYPLIGDRSSEIMVPGL